jgi:RecB family exonuclease
VTTLSQKLFAEAFEAEVLDVVEDHPDTRAWSAAGRGRRKNLPDGEDGKWWRENGPPMVDNWIRWRAKSGWKVWTTPSGEPAIELSQEFLTPKGRHIKGFIDRVFVLPSGELAIVDLKSGARTPESDLQLGFYRYCLYNTTGIDIRKGAYWMARSGEMTELYNLTRITPALMSFYLRKLDEAIEHQIFIPHISFRCRACSHRDYCVAFGGSKSHMDPDHEEVAA